MMLRCAICLLLISAPLRADVVIGMAFPPVSTQAHVTFSASALGRLGLNHVRIAETWERRGLTPSADDFAPLVSRLRALEAADLDVLLTVELRAPNAACGAQNRHACVIRPDAPFETYLTTLLQVAGPYIEAIQIGNEWDNRFPGTAAEFLQIHARAAAVIRANRPDLTLVLGGVTGRAGLSHALCSIGADPQIPTIDWPELRQQFCVRGAGRNAATQAAVVAALAQADYDVADIHLYDAPGLWPDAVNWMRSHTHAPIWVTEFGGPTPDAEPSDPDYQAMRLQVYLDAIDTLPIARAYYFKLTDDPGSIHANSGLYDTRGRPKPALSIFSHWLANR